LRRGSCGGGPHTPPLFPVWGRTNIRRHDALILQALLWVGSLHERLEFLG
jgi:hypothetical protein